MNKQDTFKKLLISSDDQVYVRLLLDIYTPTEIKKEILKKYNDYVDECNDNEND